MYLCTSHTRGFRATWVSLSIRLVRRARFSSSSHLRVNSRPLTSTFRPWSLFLTVRDAHLPVTVWLCGRGKVLLPEFNVGVEGRFDEKPPDPPNGLGPMRLLLVGACEFTDFHFYLASFHAFNAFTEEEHILIQFIRNEKCNRKSAITIAEVVRRAEYVAEYGCARFRCLDTLLCSPTQKCDELISDPYRANFQGTFRAPLLRFGYNIISARKVTCERLCTMRSIISTRTSSRQLIIAHDEEAMRVALLQADCMPYRTARKFHWDTFHTSPSGLFEDQRIWWQNWPATLQTLSTRWLPQWRRGTWCSRRQTSACYFKSG